MQEFRQADLFKPVVRVADFLMEKDRLFAELTLDMDELRLYDQVYASLTLDIPRPDLVIYLQAPIEVLLERIRKRAIAHEQLIDAGYLNRIVEAYASFFYYYNDAPLLIINVAEIDLVRNDKNYEQLLEQVRTFRSGRHYFNPMPIAF